MWPRRWWLWYDEDYSDNGDNDADINLYKEGFSDSQETVFVQRLSKHMINSTRVTYWQWQYNKGKKIDVDISCGGISEYLGNFCTRKWRALFLVRVILEHLTIYINQGEQRGESSTNSSSSSSSSSSSLYHIIIIRTHKIGKHKKNFQPRCQRKRMKRSPDHWLVACSIFIAKTKERLNNSWIGERRNRPPS